MERKNLRHNDHRLKVERQFLYIFKKGTKTYAKHIILYSLKSKYYVYKIGFSVGKKIGKANVRNKLKRRLREITRTQNLCKNNRNYIIVAKEGAENLSFETLKTEVEKVFKNEKVN